MLAHDPREVLAALENGDRLKAVERRAFEGASVKLRKD